MGKYKILIVDDDVDIISLLTMRLEESGYEVMASCDGKDGFAKARDQKPDLIILDLKLPKLDGYWVCGLLKKDKRYSGIPVIVFTAKTGEDDMRLAKECGADDYVVKPFEGKELLSKIRCLLRIDSKPKGSFEEEK